MDAAIWNNRPFRLSDAEGKGPRYGPPRKSLFSDRFTKVGMKGCFPMKKNSAIVPTLPLTLPPVVWGYCRESNAVPIEAQREAILRFCQATNLPLSRIYKDWSDTSDTPFADRPSGQRLWAELQPGQHLVFYMLAFAFSTPENLLSIIRECQARNITLHVVDANGKPLELTAYPWELTAKAVEAYRAHKRILQSESTRNALLERKWQGRRYTNFPGYGYRWARRGGYQIRVADPDEQRVIAWLKKSWLEGYSLHQLYSKLRDKGIKTRNGEPWSRSRIYRVLRRVLFGE